jgi:transposase
VLICPVCKAVCPIYDHADERVWRHLDLCDYRAFLHASVPRIRCPKHGVRQVTIHWADPRLPMTMAFERQVLDLLQEIKTTSGTARALGLGWDQVHGVMTRAVARGLVKRKGQTVTHVAVDEKALRKGQDYVTLIYDLDRSVVIEVIDDRTTESLAGFWKSVKYEVRAGIKAVAMDMWPAYLNATMKHIPGAKDKIVHDRFHVAQHMGKAVNDTRIEEHRRLKMAGDYSLSGTKMWWLYGQEHLSPERAQDLANLVAADYKTAEAWVVKENLRHLWTMQTVAEATSYGLNWAKAAIATGIKPVIQVANLVVNHIDQIANYAKHRISTGKAEGINSIVMAIKRAARGYRTWKSFRIAILFFCGGLDLYPQPK